MLPSDQTKIITQLHPALPSLVRDDRGAGAGYTATHPASELCKHDSSRGSLCPLAVPRRSTRLPALALARMIVTDPNQYAENCNMRLFAWVALKAARGETVMQHRLNRMYVETGK